MEERRGDLVISTDPARLDLDAIHRYLAGESYWARGISRERMERSIRHSLCFGVYQEARQVGFARVVTDQATFAYLADVYLLEELRGRGVGHWFLETIRGHPDVAGLRRWLLVTRDAHTFYASMGWRLVPDGRYMEIIDSSQVPP